MLVFLVLSMLGSTENSRFMLAHGAAYTPYIMEGEWWRLITSMFLHFGPIHLIYNMVCLIYLGDMLEGVVGPWRYPIIYVLGGIGGNLLSMANDFRTGHSAVSAGASGAIFAVIGAVLVITLINRRRVSRSFVQRMLIMAVLMLAQGFTEAGTDAVAHLGGFLAGALLGFVLYGIMYLRGSDRNPVSGGGMNGWSGRF